MTLVYFAWVREGLGKNTETLDPPDNVRTLRDLVTWLRGLGPDYERVLQDETRLRFAVGQNHAGLDTAVASGDEVAIFPPVTGG